MGTPIPPADLVRWVQGNAHAADFLRQAFDIAHVWDDLLDKDHEVSAESINRAFQAALISLPRNPFYMAHFGLLNPILEIAIINWQTANSYETTDNKHLLSVAFILRSAYSDLSTMCARIVGGDAWARIVALEIHEKWHAEGFDGYLVNLSKQKTLTA